MPNKIKTVIVDDNPYAIELLKTLVEENFPDLQITATYTSPAKATEYLKKKPCDLLLLDVQMPEMNGFELLETITPFKGNVIFTTSHDTFAVQAFRYHALHYLVKPVRLVDMKDAILRINEMTPSKNGGGHSAVHIASQFKHVINKIGLHAINEMVFVEINDIIRCHADGAYTNIYWQKEKILSSKNLKYFEELLEPRGFFRIHDSHLINVNHIKKFVKGDGAHVIMTDGSQITISRRKKNEFINLFE